METASIANLYHNYKWYKSTNCSVKCVKKSALKTTEECDSVDEQTSKVLEDCQLNNSRFNSTEMKNGLKPITHNFAKKKCKIMKANCHYRSYFNNYTCSWRCLFVASLLYNMLFLIHKTQALTCAEPGPINILAQSISSSPVSRLMTVVSDDDIQGYEFDPFEKSLRHLKVNSNSIFIHCPFFPAEFSIVASFKRTIYDSKSDANHYLVSLVTQNKRSPLAGLRVKRNRIIFEYTHHSQRFTAFGKDDKLLDGKWHTIVVAVSHANIKFYIDCDTIASKRLERNFPTRLNIKGTKIFVGSIGDKRKRFVGILAQLALFPGSDGSLKICPSTNPSFPKVIPPNENVARVFLEENHQVPTCTGNQHGLLLLNNDHELEVCTSKGFNSVRSGPERMDYVIDFEDVETNNFTFSMEWFNIPGDTLFLATANTQAKSQIFEWKDERFIPHQELDTNYANCFKYFEIGNRRFLAVANYGSEEENGGTDSVIPTTYSVVYRWSRKKRKFIKHQKFRTWRARSVEAFYAEDDFYLIVADHRTNGRKNVFKWSENTQKFVPFQYIPTKGPRDITFFFIDYSKKFKFYCFVIANALYDEETELDSEIFCLANENSKTKFISKQRIKTYGAADWEFFKIEDGVDHYRYFLIVANNVRIENGKKDYIVHSTIYELNFQLMKFILYQHILLNGAQDWEFFNIGKQYYLIASCTGNKSDTSKSLTSVIYR